MILTYPNPLLTKVSEEVVFPDPLLLPLSEVLLYELQKSKGLGLSSPQIGVLKRVVAIMSRLSTSHAPQPLVLCNPKVIRAVRHVKDKEACLSFPGLVIHTYRPDEVEFSYQSLDGGSHMGIVYGMEARCLMHEIDHLDGKLMIDSLSPPLKLLTLKKWKHI